MIGLTVQSISSHEWPSGSGVWLVYCIDLRVDALAAALSFGLQDWEEDGLGPARGAWLKLSTGRIILVYELAHAIEALGAKGPTVEVDALEGATLGLERLVSEIRSEVRLTADQIMPIAQNAESWQRDAAKLARLQRT